MIEFDPNTKLSDLTVAQFRELFAQCAVKQVEEHNFVYGIEGIAKIYNCSIATAQRIKKSGRIAAAIVQEGRQIVVDVEKALSLYNKK